MSNTSDIPPDFHSEYEERAFRCCTRCGETLADFQEGYQIAKAYRNGECVLEYALCMPCYLKMAEEFSESSKQHMEQFHQERVHQDRGLEQCAICDCQTGADHGKDYSLAGVFQSNDMHNGIVICGDCGEEMQELISKETRDVWNRFTEENFPGAPSDAIPEPTGILV